MRAHDWTEPVAVLAKHDEIMCRLCFITARRAAMLGVLHYCDEADKPKEPTP